MAKYLKSILLAVAVVLAGSVWYSCQEDQVKPSQCCAPGFILPAALIAFIWIFCIDWLLARKYHKYDGIIARIIGLIRINADHDLIESEIKKLQSFNSKY